MQVDFTPPARGEYRVTAFMFDVALCKPTDVDFSGIHMQIFYVFFAWFSLFRCHGLDLAHGWSKNTKKTRVDHKSMVPHHSVRVVELFLAECFFLLSFTNPLVRSCSACAILWTFIIWFGTEQSDFNFNNGALQVLMKQEYLTLSSLLKTWLLNSVFSLC